MEKIIIAGGGLAGALMAGYLGKRGYNVTLYERRPDMRQHRMSAGKSINLALSTRGLNALEKAGLKEAMLEQAIPMKGRMMHDLKGNQSFQPYGKEGQCIHSVSRGLLNILLLENADRYDNVDIRFEHTCIDVDLESGLAVFKNANGQEVRDQADFVIGGDGAFSAVRLEMMKTNRFNYSQDYLNHGYKELTIAPKNGEFAMDPTCLHIWPRGEYMLIALPNPDKTFTCTLFYPFEGENSFASIQDEASLHKFFTEEFPDALGLMPDLTADFFNNPTGALVTVRCFPWTRGKAALIGDAAHAVVPFYGQGMNCAFEDVVELDACMDEFLPDFSLMLKEYENRRKKNADSIADLALQNFIEMRDKVGDRDFLHYKKVEHDLCELYPDLFRSQYELVSFTLEPYSFAYEQGRRNTELVNHLIEQNWEDKITDRDFMSGLFQKFGCRISSS